MSKTELAALEYQKLVGTAPQAIAATADGEDGNRPALAAAAPNTRRAP